MRSRLSENAAYYRSVTRTPLHADGPARSAANVLALGRERLAAEISGLETGENVISDSTMLVTFLLSLAAVAISRCTYILDINIALLV